MFNLINLYMPVCEHFTVFNNAGIIPELIATGGIDIEFVVLSEDIWKAILSYETKLGETNTE